jgi:hypothetical protein
VRISSAVYVFCGYRISADGIDTEAKKVEAICSWLVQQSVGELRSFLGLAGYYRRFIEKFAHKSSYLHELVNDTVGIKRVPFHWEKRHMGQFEGLKRALSSAPVLTTMDLTQEFVLRTDASDTAIGAVLAHWQDWKGRITECPLSFYSRRLHDVETHYPMYDREILPIHEVLEHWSCYV